MSAPPRLARRLLSAAAAPEDRPFILSDLAEDYEIQAGTRGRSRARRWYWSQVLRSLPPILGRRIRQPSKGPGGKIPKPMRGTSPMLRFWLELRQAFHSLRRSPGYSAIIVLTLALVISAKVSVFSFVDGVLLRPLPYPSAQQLIFIWDGLDWIGVPRAWVAPAEVEDLRRQTTLFEGFAPIRVRSVRLSGIDVPVQINRGTASSNLFQLLGVEAALGRTFAADEEGPGSQPLVVISHGLWKSHFGASGEAIGESIEIDGELHDVIGVLPEGFDFLVHSSLGSPSRADLWTTFRVDLSQQGYDSHSLALLARIREGVSFEQAADELAAIGRRIDEQRYAQSGFTYKPVSLHGDLVRGVRPALWTLLIAVGFVLAIAASNIATIMLARTQQRGREMAIRQALGASRGWIGTRLLCESLLLGLSGGVLGLALSTAGVSALLSIAPESLPLHDAVRIDVRAAGFALALSLISGLACGLAASMQGSREEPITWLREGGRSMAGSRRATRVRGMLVACEAALAIMLLAGAGLMIRSFAALQSSDPGFRTERALTFNLRLLQADPALTESLMNGLRSLPDVESAGITSALPLSAGASQRPVAPQDRPEARVQIDYMVASPGYFSSMGIALKEGRDFAAQDRADAPPVAIVDESLARRLWPQDRAVGKRLVNLTRPDQPITVVGVVRHARLYRVYQDDRPQVYVPYAQVPFRSLSFVLRTSADPGSLAESVRSEIRRQDPQLPVYAMQTMQRTVDDSVGERRFSLILMMGFAFAAVTLAALGIYGVLSYLVAQRTSEIGVRMALGARRSRVLRTVAARGLFPALAGAGVGLAGALALSRYLSAMLHGVEPTDPATYALAAFLMLAVASAACYLPARRAAAVDPISALRND